jgi:hypothetical protein
MRTIRATAFGFPGWAILISLAFWPVDALAFTLSNGQQIACTVQTANGPYLVPEQSGFANGFAGFTQFGPNGLPYITFDFSRFPQIGAESGIMADFLFYHECGHARFGTRFTDQQHSELGANCEGLRKMRSDGRIAAAQEMAVGQFHANANIYGHLFGSGANMWQMTLACASQPASYAESVYGGGPVGPSLAPFCCTVVGPKIGPFPPPHLPVGAQCQALVGNFMVPGQACY